VRRRSGWHENERRACRQKRMPLHHATTSQRNGQEGAARMRPIAVGVKGNGFRKWPPFTSGPPSPSRDVTRGGERRSLLGLRSGALALMYCKWLMRP
jgi:hypothetical protein